MMIAWINFGVLVFSSLFFLYYYLLSVNPAAMEKVIGPQAYRRCGHYRIVAVVFEMITVASYVIYYFYPLPVPLPQAFSWSWWVSALIAAVIGVPAIYLMVIGMHDAGEEAIRPKKEHLMYGGIYKKIRHPQAAGEVFLWLVIAFVLNSPFLMLFSFIYFPIFLIMCVVEEHDLILRFGDSYADYMQSTGAFLPKKA